MQLGIFVCFSTQRFFHHATLDPISIYPSIYRIGSSYISTITKRNASKMPETSNMTAPKPTTTRTAPPPPSPYINASRFEVPQEPPPSYQPTKPPPYTVSAYRSPPRLGRDRQQQQQRQREQERERGREIHRSNMVRDVEMQRQDKKRRETNRGVRVVIAIIAGAIAGTIIGVVARYY